ncbi:MAG: polysaccharide deacetylase family protein [Hyphomicrobium zavarzinii]|jgi:peptidoglycan/xylan/chitin deacetylase (PgdA/CDA1 family)|uniref:polysaccharide deacetylase family protein n=1 Tax=Hyphomicrobium TaxID=81 RepID=UPI001A487567|nr:MULTISPECIES: polysaccharide deacetylase family protein [Hyphomicrobium]MBL8845391.1 polysaccharide deacetylase family protein [Hyphomicrobium zavarzinii]WBT40254.1 polysaccharide deacetylase family protein [Hyphomicrobium sp. DMF-1]
MRFTLSTLLILLATAATAGDASKAPPAAGAAAKAAGAAATETSALPDNPAKKSCANADALGVARTVEIDTTGGPGFGLDHYKAYDFLQEKEVVLTFDDGPQVNTTRAILDALDEQCTKAIFFSLGKMAIGLPEIIRDVAHRGHTVGTHTWSHADMRKKSDQDAKDEIEKGISGVRRAVGGPISPFFRFPYLRDSQATLAHLASRNIAVFSTDVDSFDFKRQTPEQLVQAIMKRLDKKGKGILLMHDIQPHTAKAMPSLLAALKAGGYKIVQMKAKDDLKTLAEYDAMIEKDVKGLPAVGAERPMSSVIKTVPTGQ